MRKVLTFLKSNLTFFIIVAISLVFYFIAIFGGDYQTTTFFTHVTHRKFITAISEGVPFAFAYVVLPVICLIAIVVLYFLRPKKKDGKTSVVFVSLFIAFAVIAGALFVMIPFALFKEAKITYYQLYDWKASMADVYFVKTYNFPFLSMALSLVAISILGCYSSARLSE